MKIAITGGAGFVGSHLTKAYLDAGHDVLVIDSLARGSRQDVDARARFYRLDIRDAKVQDVLRQERPDVVSHHAARSTATFPEESLLADADVQLRGLLNVLDGCVNAFVTKLIFASNGCTLYRPVPTPRPMRHKFPIAKEDASLFPQYPNDINKLAGEGYVRYYSQQYGFEHTILRYAHIYGETNRDLAQHPLTYFVDMLLRGQRPIIRESASYVRDHIFIDDVVSANLSVLHHGRNCTMHISTGTGYTLDQFFAAVAAQLASDLLPVYLASSRAEPTTIVLDNTLAQQKLCWHPQIDFAEGVQRAVEALLGQVIPSVTVEAPARVRVNDAVLIHS